MVKLLVTNCLPFTKTLGSSYALSRRQAIRRTQLALSPLNSLWGLNLISLDCKPNSMTKALLWWKYFFSL
jgi:hypothetical protein